MYTSVISQQLVAINSFDWTKIILLSADIENSTWAINTVFSVS